MDTVRQHYDKIKHAVSARVFGAKKAVSESQNADEDWVVIPHSGSRRLSSYKSEGQTHGFQGAAIHDTGIVPRPQLSDHSAKVNSTDRRRRSGIPKEWMQREDSSETLRTIREEHTPKVPTAQSAILSSAHSASEEKYSSSVHSSTANTHTPLAPPRAGNFTLDPSTYDVSFDVSSPGWARVYEKFGFSPPETPTPSYSLEHPGTASKTPSVPDMSFASDVSGYAGALSRPLGLMNPWTVATPRGVREKEDGGLALGEAVSSPRA